MLPIRKPEVRIEFGGERPGQSGDHVATAIDEFDHQRVLDSEGFRFRLIGTTQWRAGDHPTPSVSMGTNGDFEKVLECQQIKC